MRREWAAGERLENRWEIHKILKGGMGVVYIVHDHEWDEALAAKTFQDAVFARNPRIAAMFTREALAWVQLDAHPNIAQALFVQEIEGKPVLFLEYVSGGDLSEWIGTPRLLEDTAQVLRFAIAFCDGMIHARAKGITAHRDIKPQNCLITESGTLKITDFGLAKVLDGAEVEAGLGEEAAAENPHILSMSRTGNAAGTCTHMPPEQFDDSKHVGVQADIYSFGVMLFQMLTGRLPFPGRTWAELERLHRTEAPPLHLVRHPVLRDVLAGCLAKRPQERWQDFEQLREPMAALYEQGTGQPAPRPAAGAALDARQWMNKGVSLSALGLTSAAIACYDRALQIDPGFAEVWSNKGNVARNDGRLEEALQCYDHALAANPALELAWYNKGATLEILGRAEEAVPCLEQALRLNPLMAMAWSSRGVALDKLGRIEEAVASYEKALHIHPRFTAAWANQGNLLRRLGKLEEALACHDRALTIHPGLPEAHYNKANVLADLKRYDEALASYDQALEAHPGFGAAWSGKGNVYSALGRHEEALGSFERNLELRPRDADGWYNKAVTLEKLDRPEEAAKALERALELNPRDADLWVRQGGAYSAQGRPEEAYASYVAAISVNPSHAAAWQNRAVVARQLGRMEEALECHERALEIDPKMDQGLLGKANLLADLDRFEESLTAYDNLLNIHPQMAAGWFSKGATLGNADRYAEALQCFEEAEKLGHPNAARAAAVCREALADAPPVEAPPMDAGAWHNKGAELAESGRPAEALPCFEKALALSPGSTATWYGRAVALGKLGRHEEAVESYDRAIAIYPEFALAWFSKGVTLMTAMQRYREALACFEQSQRLGYEGAVQAVAACREELRKQEAPPPSGPQADAAAWHARGVELEGKGQAEEALRCFENAVAIYPQAAESWYGKGVVLGKLGRHEEEIASYDQALWLAPSYAAAWFSKGRVLGGRLKRYREASECFEQAGRLGHPHAEQAIAICQKGLAEERGGGS